MSELQNTANADPVYLQLSEQLRREIDSDTWSDKIPGLRELSERYGANIKTVNKAVSVLVEDGTLYRSRGVGTFISREEPRLGDKAFRLGLILTDVINPNFSQLVHEMQDKVFSEGASLQTSTTNNNRGSLESVLKTCESSRLDVLLVQGGVIRSNADKHLLRNSRIPIIGCPASMSGIDNVHPDMNYGAKIITEHLLNDIGSPIGYISGSRNPVQETGRFSGFCETHIRYRKNIDFNLVYESHPTYIGGYCSIMDIIEKGKLPRALLIYNETMAMGAVSALNEKGYRIPQDIGIACFDDSISLDDMVIPLTTVSYSNQEMANSLYELVTRRILYPNSTPREISLEMRLKVRQSTSLA